MVKNHRAIVLFILLAALIPAMRSVHAQDELPESPLKTEAWVRLGGPRGGMGYDLRINPENPEIMYVTDAMAGLHMSTDGGKTWFASNEGIDARSGPTGDIVPVFCVTIDPNDPDILWLGTLGFKGVYRSEDGGNTWEKRTNGIIEEQELTVRGFTVEPGNSDIVYFAGDYDTYEWGHQFSRVGGVIYKSIDGGLTWDRIWKGDSLARYVWIDPTNVDTLYASTGLFDRDSLNSDFAQNDPGGVGVLKSTDGGETWTQINNGLLNLYVGSLYMHPEDPNILFAGVGNQEFYQGGGVYMTTNGGENWTRVLEGENYRYITSVEISESDPNIIYAAGENQLAVSSDGGNTWESLIPEGGHQYGIPRVRTGFPIDIQLDPRDHNRVFINSYGGGNMVSADGGHTWGPASTGYSGATVIGIEVDPTNPAVVYTNTRSGLFKSFDGGFSWLSISPTDAFFGPDGGQIVINPENPANVVMSSDSGGAIIFSEDRGEHWEGIIEYWEQLEKIETEDGTQRIQGNIALELAPSAPNKLYAGFGLLYCDRHQQHCDFPPLHTILISEDFGLSWRPIENTGLEEHTVTSIAVHPGNADIAWAGNAGDGVFKTEDGGETWSQMVNGLSNTKILSLGVDPVDPDRLYAGTFNSGIFCSGNGGLDWKNCSFGMNPTDQITSIAVDPIRSNVVYASAFFSGVYISEDHGATWQLHIEGLANRAIKAISISSDGLTLYAASEGGGNFRLSALSQPDFDELGKPLMADLKAQREADAEAEVETPPADQDDGPGDEPGVGEEEAPDEVSEQQSAKEDTSSLGEMTLYYVVGGAVLIVLLVAGLLIFRARKR